jgi:membrane-bound lytic murein transglycosylase D
MNRFRQTIGLGPFAAVALLAACGPLAAAESYVHTKGEAARIVSGSTASGANPEIDKLLIHQSGGLWERIRLGFAMPDLDHKAVVQHAAWYAARPEQFQAIALRARRYLHFIVAEVERRGLPTELALLPFIESGFNPMALSSAKASGLWQFIPETGLKYKLAQTSLYDGRRDVIASTRAALDYLEFLYHYNHRDWHRALASYNWGEGAVARAVEGNRQRGLPYTYGSLSMPEETRNYVPRLLAIKALVANPSAFGLVLPAIPNEPSFDVVRVSEDLELTLAAQLAGIPLDEFLTLNPAFNARHAPGATGAGLVIPVERSELFRTNLERHRQAVAGQPPLTSNRKPAKGVGVTRF